MVSHQYEPEVKICGVAPVDKETINHTAIFFESYFGHM